MLKWREEDCEVEMNAESVALVVMASFISGAAKISSQYVKSSPCPCPK